MNRKDRFGKNVFEGGFLGLDNIGVFDRSAPLPTGGYRSVHGGPPAPCRNNSEDHCAQRRRRFGNGLASRAVFAQDDDLLLVGFMESCFPTWFQ